MQTSADALRDHFLGWQCRIRQIAMRQDGGRPSAGMRPRVLDDRGPRALARADGADRAEGAGGKSGLLPLPGAEIVRPARDLRARAGVPAGGLFSAAEVFQRPADGGPAGGFAARRDTARGGDVCSGIRPVPSVLPADLRGIRASAGDPARDATLWHNRLFNPALPDEVQVLAFRPDWAVRRQASPAP